MDPCKIIKRNLKNKTKLKYIKIWAVEFKNPEVKLIYIYQLILICINFRVGISEYEIYIIISYTSEYILLVIIDIYQFPLKIYIFMYVYMYT